MACFSPQRAKSLANKLDDDWQSFLFEIVVGRYLQVLGGEVEPEPLGSNGTKIDYRATFPDGEVISVECVSKRFNQQAQRIIDRQGSMSRMLDEVGPTKWTIEIKRLPAANSPDEFRSYVEHAQEFYGTLRDPAVGGPSFEFAYEGERGRMELRAIPFPNGTRPNQFGPAVT